MVGQLPIASGVAEASGKGSGLYRKDTTVPMEQFSNSPTASSVPISESRAAMLERMLVAIQTANSELSGRLTMTEQALSQLTERFEALRRELGASV